MPEYIVPGRQMKLVHITLSLQPGDETNGAMMEVLVRSWLLHLSQTMPNGINNNNAS